MNEENENLSEEEVEKKKQVENAKKAMNEFERAWQEYFENKPEPKNDEEERKEQENFIHWYNYARKQSDTGKTPSEMYKEVYGEEPKNPIKTSRMMNFEWDEEEINPLARYCPECDDWGLIVTAEDPNLYECEICGSIWRRLKPLNDGTGKMVNMPNKLKRLLEEGE
jgi:hypothetical protein